MTLLILSFLAGVLTVAAPCVFTLLPVIVGGSVARSERDERQNVIRPLVITGSLVGSIVIFTLLLQATTALLGVPTSVWQLISGTIIILLGLNFIFPDGWNKLTAKIGLHEGSNKLLGKAYFKKGYAGDILTGAALGPVFSSCSPTYALVVASILPSSFATGLAYLAAYAIGLAGSLLIIAYAGQSLAVKLSWVSDPRGNFRRFIGALFLIVGLAIILGVDKKLQTQLLESGWYQPIERIERKLL